MENLNFRNCKFSYDIACDVGSDASKILYEIVYWCHQNSKKGESSDTFRDGFFWHYRTYKELSDKFYFLSPSQVRRCVDKLLEKNYIHRETFSYGRVRNTSWFRPSEKAIKALTISDEIVSSRKKICLISDEIVTTGDEIVSSGCRNRHSTSDEIVTHRTIDNYNNNIQTIDNNNNKTKNESKIDSDKNILLTKSNVSKVKPKKTVEKKDSGLSQKSCKSEKPVVRGTSRLNEKQKTEKSDTTCVKAKQEMDQVEEMVSYWNEKVSNTSCLPQENITDEIRANTERLLSLYSRLKIRAYIRMLVKHDYWNGRVNEWVGTFDYLVRPDKTKMIFEDKTYGEPDYIPQPANSGVKDHIFWACMREFINNGKWDRLFLGSVPKDPNINNTKMSDEQFETFKSECVKNGKDFP